MNKSNNNKYLSELLKMTVKSKDVYFVRNLSLSEQVIEKPCRCDEGNADEDRQPRVRLKSGLDKARNVSWSCEGTMNSFILRNVCFEVGRT